jgi:hypothetical protein
MHGRTRRVNASPPDRARCRPRSPPRAQTLPARRRRTGLRLRTSPVPRLIQFARGAGAARPARRSDGVAGHARPARTAAARRARAVLPAGVPRAAAARRPRDDPAGHPDGQDGVGGGNSKQVFPQIRLGGCAARRARSGGADASPIRHQAGESRADLHRGQQKGNGRRRRRSVHGGRTKLRCSRCTSAGRAAN